MKKRGKAKARGRLDRLVPPTAQASSSARPLAFTERTEQRLPVGLSRNSRKATAAIATPMYQVDDRRALALLLVPIVIVAMSLVITQSVKPAARWLSAARTTPLIKSEPIAQPVIALAPIAMPTAAPAIRFEPSTVMIPHDLAMPLQPPTVTAGPIAEVTLPKVASLIVPPAPYLLPSIAPSIAPLTLPRPADVCLREPKPAIAVIPITPGSFGAKLADAAFAQTKDFVIYSATYKRIAYPMGDIPSLYGACSDLVIRAYRALGVDLQELVQQARMGGGDTNIDHRRTETLRNLFARHGEIIQPSTFPEDYKPGDVVTYYRPYSRVSRAHIAIVSDRIGASGQPMIIHNRGWGPQLEDALFVDRITGHYRFDGVLRTAAAAAKPSVSSAQVIRAGLNSAVPSFAPVSASSKTLRASVANKIR